MNGSLFTSRISSINSTHLLFIKKLVSVVPYNAMHSLPPCPIQGFFFLFKIPKLCLLQWCTKVLASCGPHGASGLYHQSSYFLLQLTLMGHLLIFPWSSVWCALVACPVCENCVYWLWATTDYYQYEHQSQLCSESAGTTKYALGEEACAD